MKSPFFFFSQTTQTIDALRLEIQRLKTALRDLGAPNGISPFVAGSLNKEELSALYSEVVQLLNFSNSFEAFKRLATRCWLSSDSPVTLRALIDCFLRIASKHHFERCDSMNRILKNHSTLSMYIRLICEHETCSNAVAIIASRLSQAVNLQEGIAILYTTGKMLADCHPEKRNFPSLSFEYDDDDDFEDEYTEVEEDTSADHDILELEKRLQPATPTED